jgi:hypothetical protein
MKIVFQDPTFSLQLLRAISETYYKGADIGECLSTARMQKWKHRIWLLKTYDKETNEIDLKFRN